MAGSTGPNIATDGLVLSLDAANKKSYAGHGTAWNDLSGNSNTGTLQNTDELTFQTSASNTVSNIGCFDFDGSNDSVECSAISSTNYTNSLWMRVDAKNVNGIISWTVGTVRRELLFVSGYLSIAYGSNKYRKIDSVLSNGVWMHVAGTYDGTTPLIYVNGVSQTLTGEVTAAAGAANKCYIGRTAYQVPFYFNGKIANVKIYNRALTSTEVVQNYNATKSRFI
jgi:hypothetical protein